MAVYAAGYLVWSKWLATAVFGLDASRPTPAHALRDDLDYVPARPAVLFGHHYASITGLAPMLGPAIAVIWGWLPALLWVVLGAVFVGCVHDFAALVVSMRARGMSIGTVAEGIIGHRAKSLFHGVIFFGVSLAMGVFVIAISQLFAPGAHPGAVLPSGGLMVVAVVMGRFLHRGARLAPVTAVGFAALLAMVWAGMEWGGSYSSGAWPDGGQWKGVLLGYGFLASVLPVWTLLQPRDFVNSLLLYLGLGLMFAGVFVSRPDFAAPMVQAAPEGAPPIFPFVFIVIACGAASGFHSLVSSGTTAKQIANEAHARPIGYGGMIGESLLGLVAVLACTAGALGSEAWTGGGVYGSWAAIREPGTALGHFIEGGAGFIHAVGVDRDLARALVAVVVVSFALTTLDSATRLLRFNIQEVGQTVGSRFLQGRHAASLLAVAAIGFFAFYRVDGRPVGIRLWALFGTVNQLLAGLALLVATLYLRQRRRAWAVCGVPCAFMLASTVVAMTGNVGRNAAAGDLPLAVIGGVLLLLGVWIVAEGAAAFRRAGREPPVEDWEVPLG